MNLSNSISLFLTTTSIAALGSVSAQISPPPPLTKYTFFCYNKVQVEDSNGKGYDIGYFININDAETCGDICLDAIATDPSTAGNFRAMVWSPFSNVCRCLFDDETVPFTYQWQGTSTGGDPRATGPIDRDNTCDVVTYDDDWEVYLVKDQYLPKATPNPTPGPTAQPTSFPTAAKTATDLLTDAFGSLKSLLESSTLVGNETGKAKSSSSFLTKAIAADNVYTAIKTTSDAHEALGCDEANLGDAFYYICLDIKLALELLAQAVPPIL